VADQPSAAGTREIDRWRASQFRDFAGARLDFRLPLGDRLLNDLVAERLLPRIPAVHSAIVRIEPDNRATITVEFARPWLPRLTVPLEIERNLLSSAEPVARLRISGSGVAGALAPLLRFVTLPNGVRVANRLIDIHISNFLSPADAATLSECLREARITTTEGTLWLDLRLAR
jgi:hypothetical protein